MIKENIYTSDSDSDIVPVKWREMQLEVSNGSELDEIKIVVETSLLIREM